MNRALNQMEDLMQRTAEDKAKWLENMKAIQAKIKAMSPEAKGELWSKLGTITAEGHALSVHNTISLYYQSGFKPAIQVGGFKQWQKVGRIVRKGEHSIGSILVPTGSSKSNDDSSDDTDIHFISVPVFDIAQTDEIQAGQ
jgi:hypothetical protein